MNRQYQGFFWGAVVALTVATSAFAGWNPDTKTYDTTGYVKLTTGDSSYSDTTCFEKPASWTWPASYGGTPAAMDPNADYCYNGKSTVSRTPNTRDFTFNARTLAVNGQFHQSSEYYFTMANMHLLNGGQCVLWGTYSRFRDCTFTVYSDADHAFMFNRAVEPGNFTSGFTFLNTTIKGEEWTVMKFHGDRALQKAAAFWWTGDGSQFYGTAIVDMPTSTVGGYSRLYLGPVNFAGTLVLTNGSQLANYDSGTVKVAKLAMKDNSSLLLSPASGGVEVTTALTTDDGTFRVKFDLGARPNCEVDDWTALTAPRGSFSAETLVVTDANGAALPDWATVNVVDEGEVTKLVLHRRGLVKLATVRSGTSGSPFIEENKDCWSDGELPHAGIDYQIGKYIGEDGKEKTSNFYFHNDATPYIFPGDSLTMEKGATVNGGNGACIPSFDCRDLRVNNAVFRTWGQDFSLGGGTITLDGKVTFLHYAGRVSVFSVDSELVGSGDVTCNSYVSQSESGSCGQLALTALNTNFTGKILVTIPSGTKDYGEVPSLVRMTTLHVYDPRNLGGALATFTPDALQLEQMSVLMPSATMTLDTPNRGIRVSGMGRIDVPKGVALTVANPITYAGTLRKEGEGTLVLAAAPIVEPSSDGGNRLEVVEGAVMASATNVLDGIAVTIGSKGALSFAVNPTGEGMREYGLVGVDLGDAATIKVAFDVSSSPDAPPEDNWTHALFTVPTAQAETLMGDIRIEKGYPRYAVDLSVRDNGDGSSTILATHVYRAYVIDAATCETTLPFFRGEGEVTVPRGVHLDFTGFAENGFIDRPFEIARGGSLVLPPDFEDWTFSPAVDGYGLVLDVVGGSLVATVGKCETAYVRPKGNLVFSGLGDAYPFNVSVVALAADGKTTTGTYKADGSVYAYGEGTFAFSNVTEVAGEVFDGVVAVEQLNSRTVRATWKVTPNVDIMRVKVVGVSLSFPLSDFAGGKLRLGGKEYDIADSGVSASATVNEIELTDKHGLSRLTLKLDRARFIYVSKGSSACGMKIYHYNTDEPQGYFEAGKVSTIAFDLSAPGPVKAGGNMLEVISSGDGWVPVTAHEYVKPGSPLDFTDVCGTGKPAGKFGRVVRVGDHFEFANLPGVEQRFHGLTSGAATFGYADEPIRDAGLADVARRGYNATRIHDYESVVVDPDDPSQTTLGEEQMRLFDGYIASSISNGLYVILELYGNHRKPSWRSIGVDADGAVTRDEAKMLLAFHEGMIANQMDYLRNYLTHVNRYTGRSFIDEPAIIGADFVNEGLNWTGRVKDDTFMTPTARRLIFDAWGTYATAKKTAEPEKYASVDATTVPSVSAGTVSGRLFVQFVRESYLAVDRRMKAFLRNELGFQGILTDLAGGPAACTLAKVEIADYSDCHFYEDHPSFLAGQFQLPCTFNHGNQNPLNGTLATLRRCRGIPSSFTDALYGYPFVMTEFNYVTPGQFRFAGGLLMGSAAALQAADGLWQHSYSFNTARNALGWFNYISDPLIQAWSRAILTLFARRDMRPLTQTYVTLLDPAAMCSDDEAAKSAVSVSSQPHTWASWYRRTGLLVADEDAVPAGVTLSGDWATMLAKTEADVMADLGLARDANGKLPIAGDGQVKIDDVDGSIMVDTPRTAGGFAEHGVIEGGALWAEIGNMPTAIWVSTLGDGRSIADSKRLLLTHLTDVQDGGLTYLEKTRQTQLTWGKLPHLMRRGVAEVELTVGPGAYFVYALSGDGERRFRVSSTKEGNVLRFTADIGADPTEATYLYEIVRRGGAGIIYR